VQVPFVPYRESTRTRRRALDREQVVRAGLVLLNQLGLDGLTMRALADHLGVKAPSLYRHVRDKHELIILMADELCAGIEPTAPGLPWRKAVVEMAQRTRRWLLSVRDGAQLLASAPPAGPRRLALIDRALALFAESGLPPREAARAAYHLNNFVTEFAADEARMAGAAAAIGLSRAQMMAEARRQFQALPAAQFPNLTRMAPHLTEDDPDGLFDFGLQIWLDGIDRRRRARSE
jgi:TetR/AcrR family transcriptional regulator, tetracycline repressor protein